MLHKNIIITGTSSGIGFEMAKQFAQAGHKVLAISRNREPLANFNHKNITILSVDVSDEIHLKKVKNYLKQHWEKVDILINNAGHLVNKPFFKLSQQDFLDVYNVNVFAVARLIQLSMPYLKKGSHVINISSIGGVSGSLKFPGLAAYSSSKAALINLTELLAEEYKDTQISFNALALGAVQTEMLAKAFPDYKAPVSAKEMAAYIVNFAMTGQKYFNGKVIEVSSTTP
ncbi:MAG: SDR family oxidoreductase [Flavobacteriales bacterium]|jgi:3-oxoacyl-[acyl-carrier protein] reductase|nr:SDR family oxidoreductase [Flavobacteriales bacterium]